MAVYGPVRHQKNIIWTEASEVHIIFFGDEPVHILPYDPSDMTYLLYYTFYLK